MIVVDQMDAHEKFDFRQYRLLFWFSVDEDQVIGRCQRKVMMMVGKYK